MPTQPSSTSRTTAGSTSATPLALATLEATLERITYANEETGYTVARVSARRGGSELLTIVGNLLGAQPGESLRLEGRWKSHPQDGRQFEVMSSLAAPGAR
jgi:exodeoxyribonuclease V alpha subunit